MSAQLHKSGKRLGRKTNQPRALVIGTGQWVVVVRTSKPKRIVLLDAFRLRAQLMRRIYAA